MNTETQVDVAEQSAPVALDDKKPEVQNTPEATAAGGEVDAKQVKEQPKTFTQAEVDALVQKRLVKEQRRTEKQLLERLQNQANQQPPQRQQFKDEDEYLEAQIEHRAEQRAQEKLARREAEERSEKMTESFAEKREKAAERYPDFQAAMHSLSVVQMSDAAASAVAEFIADSDFGADVAYHLGKNPGTAARIASLTPVKAALALAEIEREIAAKPQPKHSNAPAPIKPIGAASSSTKSPADMTDAEYAKWRKRGKA